MSVHGNTLEPQPLETEGFLIKYLEKEVGKYFTLVQIFLCFFNTFCLVEE
jgi:hypothetical protein